MNTLTQTSVRTFAVDPSHSRVGFVVRHMGFSKVRGSFERFEGAVRLAPGDLATLAATAKIEAGSISTNDPKRDAHLRSADFFDVERYPEVAFKATAAHASSENEFVMEGELTMHGVTKPIELRGTYLGEGTDPWGGARVAFEAHATVNRKEFGLNWNVVLETGGLLVSEHVEIVLEIQAVEVQPN